MNYETIAAVDLGSNSFRLQVGRIVDQQIYPLDSMKESVRLAAGLDANKYLDEAACARAIIALERFGERLRGFAPNSVRAVGTNTLRVARNTPFLLPHAEAALGFPIEIIAGREEARLIYIGAAHSLPPADYRRLVVDIGGGSTEFIIGTGLIAHRTESLYMGCVSYTLNFFPGQKIDKNGLRDARIAAAKEIELIKGSYQNCGWQEAVGSSGTARALSEILEMNHLNPHGESGITRVGLDRLAELCVKSGSLTALNLAGIKHDRLHVLPGGLAIMQAIFSELGIEHMIYADGALRQGVLYDMLGRFRQHDMRYSTVRHFQKRYQIDSEQAERVEQTALATFAALNAPNNLHNNPQQIVAAQSVDNEANQHHDTSSRQYLSWAAQLHEIGISVAHSGYHKHGAYILTYADMPGFSRKEQARLAMLVLAHRGKLDKLDALPPDDNVWRQIFCLRLAVIMHRTRNARPLPLWQIKSTGKCFQVDLPTDWLADNPWTAAALSDETEIWKSLGFQYQLNEKSCKGKAGAKTDNKAAEKSIGKHEIKKEGKPRKAR